jgi:hypothetical protein
MLNLLGWRYCYGMLCVLSNHLIKYNNNNSIWSGFFCDWGCNDYKLKCTKVSTGNQNHMQVWFICHSCIVNICLPCYRTCHEGCRTVVQDSGSFVCNCNKSIKFGCKDWVYLMVVNWQALLINFNHINWYFN